MSKPYISNSQLNMYMMCGESYRRRYIEGERRPPGIAMLRGTGVHGGAKENFRQKIESHEDLPKSDIVEMAVAEYETRILADDIELTEEEQGRGKDIVVGEGKDSVVTLSELYADEVAPEYQPVHVEEKQRIVLPGEYDLLGIMDLSDDREIVVDLKTTSRKKPKDTADKAIQLTFYALIFKALEKKFPKALRFETLIDKAVPERQMLETHRNDADLKALVDRINTMIKGVKAGVFMPCSRDSWKCGHRFCGFYRTCRYVR